MDYILQRPSGYYFRLMVPPDLKEIFGISEIKRSLKTGSLPLARERASLLSGKIKLLFRRLRNGNKMKLKKKHISGLIRDFIWECLEEEEDERIMTGRIESQEDHEAFIQGFESLKAEYEELLVFNDLEQMERQVDQRILKPRNLEADKGSLAYKKLCREAAKALVSVAKIAKKREQGDYSSTETKALKLHHQEPLRPFEEPVPLPSTLTV